MGMVMPETLCVFAVRKKCYECGQEWDGKAFVQQPDNAEPLPGVCGACIDKQEARLQALIAAGRRKPIIVQGELPNLTRPQREPGDD
jgi:hypothetical protein